MIVSKLKFLQVKSKVFLRYSMILKHPLFCKGPETFKTIDMDSPIGKLLSMIKTQMSTIDKQGLVASELIGIEYTAFLGMSANGIKYLSKFEILWESGKYSSLSLQHAKNKSFSRSCSSSVSLSSSTKVGIINLNLSRKFSKLFFGFFSYLLSESLVDSVYGLVVKVQYFAGFISWYLQSKVFNDLFKSFSSPKGISPFASRTVNSTQRIAPCTVVSTKYTFPAIHSTIYLNRFSVECT